MSDTAYYKQLFHEMPAAVALVKLTDSKKIAIEEFNETFLEVTHLDISFHHSNLDSLWPDKTAFFHRVAFRLSLELKIAHQFKFVSLSKQVIKLSFKPFQNLGTFLLLVNIEDEKIRRKSEKGYYFAEDLRPARHGKFSSYEFDRENGFVPINKRAKLQFDNVSDFYKLRLKAIAFECLKVNRSISRKVNFFNQKGKLHWVEV